MKPTLRQVASVAAELLCMAVISLCGALLLAGFFGQLDHWFTP